MKDTETEILVVGAGPAGLIAAREAAQKGVEVTILEEHAAIGRPCHCAGLLSLKGLTTIGIPSRGQFIQNRVKGARFFSPSGLSFTVERDQPVACVVDRCLLDSFLVQQAEDAGARICLNARVNDVKREGSRVTAYTGKTRNAAKLLIDAEGVSSRIVRTVGLKPLNFEGVLPGLQHDITGVHVDPNYVEVHVGRKRAPGFFAWVIPLKEDSARIGLACKDGNPKDLLEKFINNRFPGETGLERFATRSGMVVTCGPIERTFDDRVMIVGDAAGHVKPTTGGGVILGGVCASIAGEVAAEAIKRRKFSAEFLQRYERLWKIKLGKEFKTGLLARKLMNNLSDKAIDKLFRLVIEENLQTLISVEGDMDFQSNVLMKLLKKKKVLRMLLSLLTALSPFKN